jgi:hypothetical protein
LSFIDNKYHKKRGDETKEYLVSMGEQQKQGQQNKNIFLKRGGTHYAEF